MARNPCPGPPGILAQVRPEYPQSAYDARHDFVGVLVHELGHSIGLDHTTAGQTANSLGCDPAFGIGEEHDTLGGWTNASIMAVHAGSLRNWRRRLYRDDIQALRSLYGSDPRTIRISTATGSPPGAWSASVAVNPIFVKTQTPASLSSAQRAVDVGLAIGFTSATDRVAYLTGGLSAAETSTWDPPFAGSVAFTDPVEGPARSWHNVAVARGKNLSGTDRLVVAWVGGRSTSAVDQEDPDVDSNSDSQNATRIRWRVRDGATWRPPSYTGLTRYRNVGVGYAPREEQLVLAYIDTCLVDVTGASCVTTADQPWNQYLFVRTVSVQSDSPGWCLQAMVYSGHVLAVGSPVCDERGASTPTTCAIPVTTAEVSGPRVRFIEGTIEPLSGGGHPCFKRQVEPETTLSSSFSFGLISAALDGRLSNGRLMFAHTPGWHGTGQTPGPNGYSWLGLVTRNASGYANTTVTGTTTHSTRGWPLMVGSQASTSPAVTKWHAVRYE